MKYLQYEKLSTFAEKLNDFGKILKIPHTKDEYKDVTFVTIDRYPFKSLKFMIPKRDIENQEFYKMNKADFSKKHGEATFSIFQDLKKDQLVVVDGSLERFDDLLLEFSKYDLETARKWKKKYNDYCLKNSFEIFVAKNNILEHTVLMHDYLEKNNIQKEITKVDFEKKYSKKEIDDLYNKIELINSESEDKIVGYNDLDYYPFICNGYYIIEDVSADSMLICDYKDKENFIWYVTQRTSRGYDNDGLNDLNYESRNYIKDVINDCVNDFTMSVKVENGKVVQGWLGVYYINLLQSCIVDQLRKEGKIAPVVHDFSLKELIQNYTIQNDPWKIEERGLMKFLESARYVDGKFEYDEFARIDREDINKMIQQEKDLSFFMDDEIEVNESLISNSKAKEEIFNYLDDLLQRKNNSEDTIKFVEKIKKTMSSLGKKKKKKM